MENIEFAKVVAAKKAIEILYSYCKDGCILGLGTGTTVRTFVELLISSQFMNILKRCTIIVSSYDTALLLLSKNLHAFESYLPRENIDIYIDSADEVDERMYMIKGGGGAMLREKVLAMLSRYRLYIVDETKVSPLIGSKKAIPVEIEPVAYPLIAKRLRELGYRYELRMSKTRYGPTMTDNGNIIIDVYTGPLENPPEFDREVQPLPGVVTTGIFSPELVDTVIVGYRNGTIRTFYR